MKKYISIFFIFIIVLFSSCRSIDKQDSETKGLAYTKGLLKDVSNIKVCWLNSDPRTKNLRQSLGNYAKEEYQMSLIV